MSAQISFVNVGSKLPNVSVVIMESGARKKVPLYELLANKEITWIFGVPGNFTKVCTQEHFPSYVGQKEAFAAKSQQVFCIAKDIINGLEAWKATFKNAEHITMLSDPHVNADTFGAKTGLEFTDETLGNIFRRFAMGVRKDGTIFALAVEEQTAQCGITRAENLLKQLP